MKNNGYIKFHRKFKDWRWYKDRNVKDLFIHLLFEANWKDDNFRNVLIKRGSLTTGRKKLADDTGLTQQEIRTAITKLKSTNEITTKATNKYTVITVVNYNKYQSDGNTNNQQNNQPSTKRATTTKELKELKEYYNRCSGLKNIRAITEKRAISINARVKDYSLKDVYTMIDMVGNSEYLKSNRDSWATFDWCFNPNNFIKILESNYNSEVVKEKTIQEIYDEEFKK
jgi:hypothetical protein